MLGDIDGGSISYADRDRARGFESCYACFQLQKIVSNFSCKCLHRRINEQEASGFKSFCCVEADVRSDECPGENFKFLRAFLPLKFHFWRSAIRGKKVQARPSQVLDKRLGFEGLSALGA